jgi:hypothetical protein
MLNVPFVTGGDSYARRVKGIIPESLLLLRRGGCSKG